MLESRDHDVNSAHLMTQGVFGLLSSRWLQISKEEGRLVLQLHPDKMTLMRGFFWVIETMKNSVTGPGVRSLSHRPHATALAVARRARVAEHALRRTRVCPRAYADDPLYPPTHPVAY